MFRELTRKKQQLPQEQCIDLLKSQTRGVLSVLGDNDYPYGMPMNHFYNDRDGCIYFHCGKGGHRLDALKKHNKVSFCTYGDDTVKEGKWSFTVKSVIVFGKMDIIDDIGIITDITRRLSYKFTNDTNYIETEIASSAHKTLLLKLTPDHICGKTTQEE